MSRPWAHPHSRGENYSRSPRVSAFMGSSPLMRGKRGHGGKDETTGRLIPTHAGKTVRSPSVLSSRTAHPRSCGENTS